MLFVCIFVLQVRCMPFNLCKEVVYVPSAIISYFHNLNQESTIYVFLSLVSSDYKIMVDGV